MKNKVYTIANNIICSLGNTTQDVFEEILNENSGVKHHPDLGEVPMSRIDRQGISNQFQQLEKQNFDITFFEQLLILSIQDAISKTDLNIKDQDVICIISTTKGNIELLQNGCDKNIERSYLTSSAQVVKNHFNLAHTPLIVSNACVSGVVAINQAVRLLNINKFKHAIVVGADTLSEFIISGFLSFKSLCETICKPFDKNRTGLNLGEG
ncbi:MAG: hypothetical protein MI922_15350, partial [Bacteroidales bacterium]|nr:hypothetical protein [Bacteroidales bacterium]